MSSLLDLTDSQKQILANFPSCVADILNETHDDYFLTRWLTAGKWNPEKAEKMLRMSMKTRDMWNIENLHKWEPPQALKDYLPYGKVGYDKDGSPIVVCPFYNLDIYGVLHSSTRFDFMRYSVKLLEGILKDGYEQSKRNGNPNARQLVVFFDVANLDVKQFTWRPAAELIINTVRDHEQHYPEILKTCYIINAPKLFAVSFNLIKKFLDEKTKSKINIYNHGSEEWKDDLFSHVDPNIFPKCFGGNYTDNGDEKCPSKIIWAGKVPEELYLVHKEKDDSNKHFIETTVNNGDKLKLEFEVVERKPENEILAWEFRTIDHDIRFGIYSEDIITGEKHSEVPLGTVCSNEMDDLGFFYTRPNTRYIVVFDNSASYLRSKKLRYWIALISEKDHVTKYPSHGSMVETEVVAVGNEA